MFRIQLAPQRHHGQVSAGLRIGGLRLAAFQLVEGMAHGLDAGAAINHASNAKTVAEQTGLPYGSFSRWMTGASPPSVFALAKIARACGVTIPWLLGEDAFETMHEPSRVDMLGRKVRGTLALDETPAPGTVLVPVLDVAAAAGSGAENGPPQVVGHLPFTEEFLHRAGVAVSTAHLLTAHGESMWPTIRDGALVLVDRVRHRPRHDNIYVLVDGGDVRLKRYVRRADAPYLISDNPDKSRYPDEALSLADLERIKIEGRVCWTETRL